MRIMLKFAALFALGLSCGWLSAQSVYVYPATITAPRGSYQSCTAVVTDVNLKTVTWSTSGGTLVGTNPGTANEPNTIALYTTTAGTYTVTATTNVGAVTGTCVITVVASPTPLTTHPRLGGMTAANLSAMQAKAISGNTLYNSGEYANAVTLYTGVNAKWNWSCGGGVSNTKTGQPTSDQSQSYQTGGNYEEVAWFFAHMALVDPSDPTYKWGCYAHDLWSYYQNYWLSPDNSQYTSLSAPYRATDEQYGVTGNHGSDNTTYLTMTPDWLMGSGFLGAGSGATMTATLTSGTMNTPTITAAGTGYLINSNVYWYAYGGSCTTQGHYGNFESSNLGNNGIAYAAMGVVQTSGSGVVAGTVTTLANATGCSTAPTISVYSDQTVARNYLTMAAGMNLSVQITGTVATVGSYNSSSQFNSGGIYDFTSQRAMGNNYTQSRQMYLVAAALTFNDTTGDDPTLPQTTNTNTCNAARGTVCADGSAANLHAYWSYETGGMLYKAWAHFEDPNVSWQAYQSAYANLPTQPKCGDSVNTTNTIPSVPCFGDGRGGEGSEGTSYAYSFYRSTEALLSIHSAGYDDPILYGPQMSLATSSFWDLHVNVNLGLLSYTNYAAQPRYSTFFEGDIFNFPYPATFEDYAWLLVYDAAVGRTDRSAKLEWPLVATSVGGPSALYVNLANSYGGENSVPMFIALPSGDPSTSFPSDPRGTLPAVTYSANNQSIFARSAWVTNGPESPSDTGSPPATTQQVFFSRCPNTRIDHEVEDCGRVDILSNGEYISKARAIAPEYNYYLSSAEHANLFGAGVNQSQTACTYTGGVQFIAPECQGMQQWAAQTYTNGSIVGYNGTSYYQANTNTLATDVPGTAGDWTSVSATATRGAGQFFHGLQAGNATLKHSELPSYIAFAVDQTLLYCGTSVTSAGLGSVTPCPTAVSRSLLYLRGTKQVVYYDREAGASNSRDWVNTTGAITISGNTASWPTQSNTQKAYLTNLLPTSGVTISNAGGYLTNANGYSGTPDWEAVSHVLEDLGSPSSAQVLNVLEWGASGFSKTTTTLVQSSSGQNFDGSLIGLNVVMFMRTPTTFTGTVYPASGGTTHYVSDLTPNTSYSVTGAGTPGGGVLTDTAGVLTFEATGTGNITIGTASPTTPQVVFSGTDSISGSVVTK